MEDKIFVREATLEDFDECVKVAISSISEVAIVQPDHKKLLEHIYAALTRDHGIMGIIGEPGGQVEGGILLRMGTFWYSNELVLEEKCVFVRPEFRTAKGGRASKLVKWGMEASNRLGVPLAFSVMSAGRMEGKMRLFERMLGKQAGAYFLYNGTPGGQTLDVGIN